MILSIDTTEFGKVIFCLDDGKKKIKKSFPVRPQESDKILEYLNTFLKDNKIVNPKSEVLNLVIYKKKTGNFTQPQKSGAGFTGLRIAAAVAQALSLAWGVPLKVFIK